MTLEDRIEQLEIALGLDSIPECEPCDLPIPESFDQSSCPSSCDCSHDEEDLETPTLLALSALSDLACDEEMDAATRISASDTILGFILALQPC